MSAPRAEHIPAEMRRERRWVTWRGEKIPHVPGQPERRANSTDPSTWGDFDAALADVVRGLADGIGFVLGDGWVGLDLDGCINAQREIHPTAREYINRLRSYTEVSPSGTGIHVIVRGVLPEGGRRINSIEVYDGARYFTVTGAHVEGTPLTVEDRSVELAALHADIFGTNGNCASPRRNGMHHVDDGDIIERVRATERGALLLNGDWQSAYPSQSEADQALCTLLAFHTSDADQIDALFRTSGLYRKKWERDDYRGRTINNALAVAETDKAMANHGARVANAVLASALRRVAGEHENNDRQRPIQTPLVLKRLLEGDPAPPPSLGIEQFALLGDINFFGGHGDAGKSTTLFLLAVCTVLGRPLFGTLRVNRRGPVVLIVPEDGEAVARHHVEAAIAGLDADLPLTREERAKLVRDLHIFGDERRLDLLRDTAAIAEAIADIHPVAVIADPIASLIGSENENDQKVAEAVCDGLRRHIARPLDAAVILAGHLRKPDRASGGEVTVHDVKGSSGWANHSRLVWLVSKKNSTIAFRKAKGNRLPPGLEHTVVLDIDADAENPAKWNSYTMTDANAQPTAQDPVICGVSNENERQALLALDDRHEPGLRLAYTRWREESGITTAGTFKNVRKRLLDRGLAEAIPTGRPARNGSPEYVYGITEDGRRALLAQESFGRGLNDG